MLKTYFSFILLIFVCTFVRAQEAPMYSHFLFNKLAYNPAFAGGKDVAVVQALYRQQWQNIVGAPRTANVNFHTPFAQQKCGLGMMVTQDQLGLLSNTYADLMYAYRLKTSETGVLSVGLQARIEYARFNWNKAKSISPTDNILQNENENLTKPNFGVGAYYKDKNFFFGFSVPQLLESTLYRSSYEDLPSLHRFRTYYLMTGAELALSPTVDFMPGVLVSYIANAPLQAEINANLVFSKTILVGASYRVGSSVDGLVGIQLTKQLMLGLAYDYSISKLRKENIGSFEAMLEYQFDYNRTGVNHLRYF